jgi:hypothetical protein
VAALVLVLGCLLSGAFPASAGAGGVLGLAEEPEASDDQPDDEPAEKPAAVRIELLSVGPPVVEPASTLVVRAVVVNDGDVPLPAGLDVDLMVQRSQLSTRSSVVAWTALAPDDPAVGSLAARRPLTVDVPPGGRVAVELSAPAADLQLRATAGQWGPRGISVLLRHADGSRLAVTRTHVVWYPARGFEAPTSVAVLLPLTAGAPDPTTGTLPAARLEQLTAPGAPLDAALAAAGAPGVTLAVDPAVVDPAVHGSGPVPAASSAWTARLQAAAATRETLLLPYGDADLSSLAHAGTRDLAELARRRAGEVADAVLGPAAGAEVAWPAADDADPAALALLLSLGYRAVVLAEAAQPPAQEPRATLTGRSVVDAGDGTLAGLLADTALSQTLGAVAPGPAAAEGEGTGQGAGAVAVQRLLAETAAITLERPSDPRTVLVTAPRGWAPTPADAVAAVRALTDVPWVAAAGVQALLDTAAPDLERVPPDLSARQRADELPAGDLRRLDTQLAAVRGLATALGDPRAATAAAEGTAVALASTAWRREDLGTWRAAVDAMETGRAALQGAVRVVPGSPLTQVSREVELPVTIENTLDQAVSVVLAVRSTSSRLAITGDVPVEVAANSTELAQVPVRGVGSGEATVVAQARAPGGAAFGEPVSTRVTVRADWETRGTLAVGALAGVVLVLGLVRAFHRGRRPSGHDPLAGPG